MFFRAFDEEVRKIFNEDKAKYLVMSWIIFKTNYQEKYNGLKENQCYFSYSVIEEELNLSHKKLIRIMKELEKDGFINWAFKSKTRHKQSMLNLLKEGTSKGTDKGTGKSIENTVFIDDSELVKEPVKEPSSRNISRNISKNISKNIDNPSKGESKKEIPKEYIELYEYWNSLNIIKHKDFTEDMIKAMSKALKKYDIETIKTSIKNYEELLHDERHYFSYEWTLKDFMTGTKRIPGCLEDGSYYRNYKKEIEKLNKKSSSSPIERKVTHEYVEF